MVQSLVILLPEHNLVDQSWQFLSESVDRSPQLIKARHYPPRKKALLVADTNATL